jgi:hypothetical protein
MLRPGFALLRLWRFGPLGRCRAAQVRAPALRLDEHAGDFRIGGLDLGLHFTYPDYSNPGVVPSLGALGLDFVLENGRSGYFPRRVAQSLLDRGRVHLVPGAPVFPFPAYVVYDTSLEADLLEIALEELRRVAMAVDEHLEDREILGSEPTRAPAGAG